MTESQKQPHPPAEPRPAAWGVELADWTRVVTELGLPAYRAKQIWHSLQERLIGSWEELTLLPGGVRRELAERFDVAALRVVEVREAADGVRKLLLACRDGELIESVLIPAESRWTLCVSSQAGCAHACAFCASGKAGLSRNLVAGEIVGQALLAAQWLRHAAPANTAAAAARTPPLRPQNIVVMGMGEPLANYDEVLRALRILNAPDGLHIGARHITISTCGVVPGIRRLAEEGLQFELSVSLHAPNDPLRTRLMPVNQRWPLSELLGACHDYTDRTNRIITFEYTLVRGLNDQPQQAQELSRLLRGWKCHVNLIPLSPVAEFTGQAPEDRTCEEFQQALEAVGIATTLRRSRGRQADAACGQLRLRRMNQSA